MKKLLLSAIAVMLSVQLFAQPNIEDYENPGEIPSGSYAVPYGESGEWLIIEPGFLTEILNSYNDGTTIHWAEVLAEIEALPQVGSVASLTNLLSNYIPSEADYPVGGAVLCCTDMCVDRWGHYYECGWCWAHECHLCDCFDELWDYMD